MRLETPDQALQRTPPGTEHEVVRRMNPHTKLLLALGLCPLSVVVVSLGYALLYTVTPHSKNHSPFLEIVGLYSLYGVPMAYLCLAVVGLPNYLLARRLQFLSYITAVLTALIACALGADLMALGGYFSSFARAFFFLIPYGLCIALLFARLLAPTRTNV
jgi:hypothetical protein